MRRDTAISYATLALTSLMWGATFVSTKILLCHLTPVEVLFYRFLIAYAACWLIHPRRAPLTPWRNELLLLAAAAVGIVLYFACENTALLHSPASSVGPLVSTTPMMTLLLSAWINRDTTITRSTIAGALAGLAGVTLVFYNGAHLLALDPLGNTLALGAALCWAVYCVLLKRVTGMPGALALTRRLIGYALLAMLPLVAATGLHAPPATLLLPTVAANLLFLGLGASALGYLFWNAALASVGAVRASYFLYFIPVVTLATAALILAEPITPYAIAGAALIIAGLWLSDRGK
jgi:drug/metabolite transporter (DMT)-like permease